MWWSELIGHCNGSWVRLMSTLKADSHCVMIFPNSNIGNIGSWFSLCLLDLFPSISNMFWENVWMSFNSHLNYFFGTQLCYVLPMVPKYFWSSDNMKPVCGQFESTGIAIVFLWMVNDILYDSETTASVPDSFQFPYEPYDIQVQLMKQLYEALELGKIGIFESPTGTVSNIISY